MISDNGLMDIKTGYDMVNEEMSSNDTINILCGHRLNPFSKIVDGDDDIVMTLGRARVTCHEIYAPFRKWANGTNRV